MSQDPPEDSDLEDSHPDPHLLDRFMRNAADGAERRRVVRHLLAGCARCAAVTRQLWDLGEPPAGRPVARERDPARLREDAAVLHQEVRRLVEAGRGAEALPRLHRARRLYRRLGDGPNLARLRHLEGRIGEALGVPGEAEIAFADARRGFLLEGLGGEAAEALLDLAVLYARQGRSPEIRALTEDLMPILRTRDLRQGVGAALLFFRRLAETEHATLEALSEISRYVRPLGRPPVAPAQGAGVVNSSR
jgi:hypothetical protein